MPALVLVAAAACLPARHDYEGAACDGTHPCPSGLVCSTASSTCVTSDGTVDGGGSGGDAGVVRRVNVLPEGDFEADVTALGIAWAADGPFEFSRQDARHGLGSMRVTGSTLSITTSDLAVHFAEVSGWFCVEGWLRGTGTATVTFSYDGSEGSATSLDRPEAHATLNVSEWTAVRTRLGVQSPLASKVTFALGSPGSETWLDDVQVWHSDGSCSEQ